MRNQFGLIFALILGIPGSGLAQDTLIFAIDVIRHGDRTPGSTMPTVAYEWKEGLGQLTADGMRQEYELGVALRKKYVEKTQLLPKHYETGTMYVRSTDYDRTLMSAQSLLMGLYPLGTGPSTDINTPALPKAFQPIPIHSAPYQYDDVILQHVDYEEREKLMEEYVYSTSEWMQKNNELKGKYDLWSRLTGVNIKSLDDLESLGDTLRIHKIHKAPMPVGLSVEDIQTIIDAGEWAFMAEERPLQLAIAYNTQIMTHIAQALQSATDKKSKLKYVLLSAHDITIAGSLSYLGAPLDKAPPYASNLNFALYENAMNQFTVQVTYNGTAVFIPGCGGTVCELEQFMKVIKH